MEAPELTFFWQLVLRRLFLRDEQQVSLLLSSLFSAKIGKIILTSTNTQFHHKLQECTPHSLFLDYGLPMISVTAPCFTGLRRLYLAGLKSKLNTQLQSLALEHLTIAGTAVGKELRLPSTLRSLHGANLQETSTTLLLMAAKDCILTSLKMTTDQYDLPVDQLGQMLLDLFSSLEKLKLTSYNLSTIRAFPPRLRCLSLAGNINSFSFPQFLQELRLEEYTTIASVGVDLRSLPASLLILKLSLIHPPRLVLPPALCKLKLVVRSPSIFDENMALIFPSSLASLTLESCTFSAPYPLLPVGLSKLVLRGTNLSWPSSALPVLRKLIIQGLSSEDKLNAAYWSPLVDRLPASLRELRLDDIPGKIYHHLPAQLHTLCLALTDVTQLVTLPPSLRALHLWNYLDLAGLLFPESLRQLSVKLLNKQISLPSQLRILACAGKEIPMSFPKSLRELHLESSVTPVVPAFCVLRAYY